MTDDRQVDATLRTWLQATTVASPDAYSSVRAVMARLPEPSTNEAVRAMPKSERRFTVSSAFRFVAAAAIVVLFGGFLLAGVLTTPQGDEVVPAAETASPTTETRPPDEVTEPPDPQPSPTTTEELLSGMVIEEVEPGVFQVVNDGVRGVGDSTWSVNVGHDGSVWLFTGVHTDSEYHDRPERFVRLGSAETYPWPEYSFWGYDLEVAPDGTMWVIGGRHDEARFASDEGRRSTDGEEWAVQTCPQGRPCRAFTVAPDGTVWASWREDDGRWPVGHLGPTGWQPLEGYSRSGSGSPFKGYEHLFITDAGDIYGTELTWGWALYRYEDGEWEPFSGGYALIDVGRDGTIWHDIADDEDADTGLYRFADGEWTRWTPDDLPAIRSGFALGHEPRVHDHEFKVAPDGSLWFSLWQQGADGSDPSLCDGLARFDGVTLDRFLRGLCTSAMDITPDGSVWLRTGSHDGSGLYVITPEAVAATE